MADSVRCVVGQIDGQQYWLVQTGVGPEAAAQTARAVLHGRHMGAAVSTGFACALVAADVGDVVIGTDVAFVQRSNGWMVGDPVRADGTIGSRVFHLADDARVPVKRGSMVSVSSIVCTGEDKRRLAQTTGAIALDMESAALAAVAAEYHVPFAIIRTVSDLVDEDLPLDFNLFLKPAGWLAGIGSLVWHPSGLMGLNRLRRQSRLAADRLTRIFELCAREGLGGIGTSA